MNVSDQLVLTVLRRITGSVVIVLAGACDIALLVAFARSSEPLNAVTAVILLALVALLAGFSFGGYILAFEWDRAA